MSSNRKRMAANSKVFVLAHGVNAALVKRILCK